MEASCTVSIFLRELEQPTVLFLSQCSEKRLEIASLHDSVKAERPRIQPRAGNIPVGRRDVLQLLLLYDEKSQVSSETGMQITVFCE